MEPLATSIEQTCQNLGGISRATVYRYVAAGQLELVKIGVARSGITMRSQKAFLGLADAA